MKTRHEQASRRSLTILLAAGALALAAAPVLGAARDAGPPENPAASAPKNPDRNLGSITVHGRKLPPICILDTIKFALQTSYSPDPAKADEVVCRFITPTGSHIAQYLWCETNGMMTKRYESYKRGRPGEGQSAKAFIGVALLEAHLPRVNVSKIKTLLAQLPAAPMKTCL